MRKNDSVMREKIENKIYSILYDHSCLSDGNIGVRVAHEDEWPIKELADLYSHSLAEARREWVEEMRKGFDKKAHNLTENDEYWGITSENMDDLLTGDNPEETK